MSARVLQMKSVPADAPRSLWEVETVEASVNFTTHPTANEDGFKRLCQIDLPNQKGDQGRVCGALLAAEHLDDLIGPLTAWKALP